MQRAPAISGSQGRAREAAWLSAEVINAEAPSECGPESSIRVAEEGQPGARAAWGPGGGQARARRASKEAGDRGGTGEPGRRSGAVRSRTWSGGGGAR